VGVSISDGEASALPPLRESAQYDRAAKALAEKKGVVVGRPREKLTDEKIERIHKLQLQRYSQRQIAYIVGVSRGLVQYVLAQKKVD
jgi:hypothetical protein